MQWITCLCVLCMSVLQIEPSEALTGKLMEELNSIAERYGT